MPWWTSKKGRKAAEKVGKTVKKEVEDRVDAVKDKVRRREITAKVVVGAVAKGAARAIGEIECEINNAFSQIIEKVAGEEARKIFEDLRRLARPIDARTAESYLARSPFPSARPNARKGPVGIFIFIE